MLFIDCALSIFISTLSVNSQVTRYIRTHNGISAACLHAHKTDLLVFAVSYNS
jgi:hypothetical protein